MYRRILALILAITLVVGCQTTTPSTIAPAPKPIAEQTITVNATSYTIFNATPTEFASIRSEFLSVPPEVWKSACNIRVVAVPDDHIPEDTVAHFDTRERCRGELLVCVARGRTKPGTVRHELTHVSMHRRKLAYDEWHKKVGATYIGKFWRLFEMDYFPKNGFLSAYAMHSAPEDVARFVEECYRLQHRIPDKRYGFPAYSLLKIKPIEADLYIARLELVHKWALITKDEYKTALAVITRIAAFAPKAALQPKQTALAYPVFDRCELYSSH